MTLRSGYRHNVELELTRRQRDVLRLVAAGKTNAEIAEELGIGYESVKSHVSEVLGKLGVDRREEAAARWREEHTPRRRVARFGAGILVLVPRGGALAACSALILGGVLAIAVFLSRGDGGGVPPGTLTPGPPGAPVEGWRYAAPAGYNVRLAASGDVVVAAAAPEFPQFHPEGRFVVALERDSGAVRWRASLPCVPLYPAVDSERAYLPCNDGTIHAWRLRDGAEAWTVGASGAPVFIIPHEYLLLVADGDPDEDYDLSGVDPAGIPDGRVRAFEKATGQLLWELPLASYSSYLALKGGFLYVATTAGNGSGEALAVNPPTGEVLWRTSVGSASSRPFVTSEAVFVADERGGLHRLSARDGSEQWRSSAPGGGVFVAPVSLSGIVVAGTNVNAIYGLSASDGSVRLRDDFCDCAYDATVVGDLVLVSGPALALLDPASLRPAWSFVPGRGLASPVVVNGWFFAPAGNEVIAFRYR